MVPDCRRPILRAIIRGWRNRLEMEVNGWHGYDALIDNEYEAPFLVKPNSQPQTVSTDNTNILAFWNFTQERLEKFNGVPHRTFHLHLKESEWRFNHGDLDLYNELLALLSERPI
jgi:hypothetical protein